MQPFGFLIRTNRSQDQRRQHLKPSLLSVTVIITTRIDCCRRGIGHVFEVPSSDAAACTPESIAKAKGKRTATCNDPPWLPGADPLSFITFIIGTTGDSCNPIRDPKPTPSGTRAAFIMHYVYHYDLCLLSFYYRDHQFIIFIIFITIILEKSYRIHWGGLE